MTRCLISPFDPAHPTAEFHYAEFQPIRSSQRQRNDVFGAGLLVRKISIGVRTIRSTFRYVTSLNSSRTGTKAKNGYNERFNGTLRHEVLNPEVFYSLDESQAVIVQWIQQYNHMRPHQSLNNQPLYLKLSLRLSLKT